MTKSKGKKVDSVKEVSPGQIQVFVNEAGQNVNVDLSTVGGIRTSEARPGLSGLAFGAIDVWVKMPPDLAQRVLHEAGFPGILIAPMEGDFDADTGLAAGPGDEVQGEGAGENRD